MTRPLRIGYLVPEFPGHQHDCLWREIVALERLGHSVTLLSTRRPLQGSALHDWSEGAAARTTYLGTLDPLNALGGLTRLLPRGLGFWMAREGLGFSQDVALVLAPAQRLLSLARDADLDHVHVHSSGRGALIAALCQKIGGPPYSLSLDAPLSAQGPGQRVKWAGALFASIASDTLRAEVESKLAGYLPPRLLARPPGVDTELYQRPHPYAPVQHGKPMRLFSCGRLAPEKGHQDVIAAMRQLLDLGVDVRLEIAGEDIAGGAGYRSDLVAHLKALHLRDHVKLLGAIDGASLREKLWSAHAFVLASWDEPVGLACLEAMAAAVPVFATEAGGMPELIADGGTGVLVPPRNPGLLARALRDFAGNPDFAARISAAGRAEAEIRYNVADRAAGLAEEIAAGLTCATTAA